MRGTIVLVAGIAFALGFVVARLPIASDELPLAAHAPRQAAPAQASAPDGAVDEAPSTIQPVGERVTVDAGPSTAQHDAAREEALRAWGAIRAQPMSEQDLQRVLDSFDRTMRTLPVDLAKSMAERAQKQDADAALLKSDDALAILANIARDDPGLVRLVNAPASFAALFRPRVAGTTLDGPTVTSTTELGNGATLVFPAGVFRLDDLARGRATFPSDVVVRGSGMDRTLLVADALRAPGNLERFTIEDCTLFADDGVTDTRRATVVALRRVRIVGFDCGAGGSCAIYASRASAVLALECRFEGGYGRSPMHGTLVDSRDALIARFDRCVLDRVGMLPLSIPSAVFANCTITDLLGELPRGPVFENCSVQRNELHRAGQWSELEQALRRDLNALFPGWQQLLQAQRR
jgi:hypothetical protein